MKNTILVFLATITWATTNAQLHIQSGASIQTTGTATIYLNDIDLDNEGTFDGSGGSTVVLKQTSSTVEQHIGGAGATTFHNLHVERNSNNAVLHGDVTINSNLQFVAGLLDLNGHDITLDSSGQIVNENENNRIIGPSGGVVQKTVDLNGPSTDNPGNLGFEITSAANLGSTLVQRGHVPLNTPQGNGTLRYFEVTPTNNANLNATVRLYYFDAENPNIDEDSLEIWRQTTGDWDMLLSSNKDLAANWLEKEGVAHLSSWTLAQICPLLSFYADMDTDGFGNAALLLQDCDQPSGYVADNTDCDDNNGNIHPGAAEICNGLDDDCNGSPESASNTWTGMGDGTYWSDAANWSDGLVPLECQDVVIPVGQTVVVPAGMAAKGKTLDIGLGTDFSMDPSALMDIGN